MQVDLFILATLQGVHIVHLLVAEEDGSDDNQKHEVGHLVVYLLPCYGLLEHIFFRVLSANHEAHPCLEHQGYNHAVQRITKEQVIDLPPHFHHDNESDAHEEYTSENHVY